MTDHLGEPNKMVPAETLPEEIEAALTALHCAMSSRARDAALSSVEWSLRAAILAYAAQRETAAQQRAERETAAKVAAETWEKAVAAVRVYSADYSSGRNSRSHYQYETGKRDAGHELSARLRACAQRSFLASAEPNRGDG